MEIWDKYANLTLKHNSLYMLLLHANFLDVSAEDKRTFSELFADAVATVPASELQQWMVRSWREQLTAAWIVAARGERALREEIAEKLLASRTCFSGQGFCVATARFGDQQACEILTSYLKKYLPVGDREYDQRWAIGALLWLDDRLETKHAEPFLANANLWKVVVRGEVVAGMDPQHGIARMRRAMIFLDEHFPMTG